MDRTFVVIAFLHYKFTHFENVRSNERRFMEFCFYSINFFVHKNLRAIERTFVLISDLHDKFRSFESLRSNECKILKFCYHALDLHAFRKNCARWTVLLHRESFAIPISDALVIFYQDCLQPCLTFTYWPLTVSTSVWTCTCHLGGRCCGEHGEFEEEHSCRAIEGDHLGDRSVNSGSVSVAVSSVPAPSFSSFFHSCNRPHYFIL